MGIKLFQKTEKESIRNNCINLTSRDNSSEIILTALKKSFVYTTRKPLET